jgi:voltage-dependent anion channel protein 2
LEGKYTDKPTGIYFKQLTIHSDFPSRSYSPVDFLLDFNRGQALLLMFYRRAGLTLTQSWNTVNALDTKIELNDTIAKGLKAELLGSFLPATQKYGAKVNLHFKQANFHGRAFFDLLKGPTANVDAVLGQDGFLVGASAGYDVQKAAITNYSAAIGYSAPQWTTAVTAANNLSIFSASYYHKVNSQVEAGAKATWDSKAGNQVGVEVASKYRLDPVSFAKVRTTFTLYRLAYANVKNSSRSTTAVSQLSPTTSSSAPASPSASAPPLIPRSSTKPPTRSVPLSPSKHRVQEAA